MIWLSSSIYCWGAEHSIPDEEEAIDSKRAFSLAMEITSR